ncbi:hypothetical protein [Haloarcula sp. Atlit-7R]|uniref:transcriptional regulator FilR1 domain-containing protein n=1 Tax=Haloarcula sp. Atlit-7R TaxID=2282125 RepID=UPI000EF16ECE|nr:hypothetical protein [Haloarcula sp. Atlit-7R]RLM90045.1 hypothetical protein D3D01_18295 [Haloarcula sp. Atlit-7R]
MIRLEESDVEAVLEKLKSLVSSPAKFQILLDASNGLELENIGSRYNYTEYTIKEKKDELIKEGLIKEKDEVVQHTKRGSHIAESLSNLYNDFLLDNRVRPFFEYIDCDDEFIPRLDFFIEDAKLLRESDDIDLTVQNHYKESLKNSDSLKELLPFPLGLRQETEEEILSDESFEAEYILSEDFLSDINNNAHYQKRMYEYANKGNVSWYVAESLPYMLSIFDTKVIFTTHNSRLKISLDSHNEEIINWANTKYDVIKESADKLQITSENGNVEINRIDE